VTNTSTQAQAQQKQTQSQSLNMRSYSDYCRGAPTTASVCVGILKHSDTVPYYFEFDKCRSSSSTAYTCATTVTTAEVQPFMPQQHPMNGLHMRSHSDHCRCATVPVTAAICANFLTHTRTHTDTKHCHAYKCKSSSLLDTVIRSLRHNKGRTAGALAALQLISCCQHQHTSTGRQIDKVVKPCLHMRSHSDHCRGAPTTASVCVGFL
jgi:hypothetical protein